MSKRESKDVAAMIDFWAAIVLGVAALAAFGMQIQARSATTTSVETALFNLLQFILTAGFAWFSTRAISRREFGHSLRQFALGAYRRIADIDAIVSRLRGEVGAMIADAPSGASAELRVVEAITTDACQMVRSSIADWADVLGEELETLEKIRDLRSEQLDIAVESSGRHDDTAERVRAIEERIEELREQLPAPLRLDVPAELRKARADSHAAEWIADQHRQQGGLELMVVTGDEYDHDREWEDVALGEPCVTVKGGDYAVEVADLHGKVIGRLQNHSPLGYNDFMRAMEVCYGVSPLPLKVTKKVPPQDRSGQLYAWYYVQIQKEPVLESQRRQPRAQRRGDAARLHLPPTRTPAAREGNS